MRKIIGGEFEIYPVNISLEKRNISRNVYTYASGRVALYNILQTLEIKKKINNVFLPDYLCYSLIYVVKKIGLSIKLYRLEEDLTPNIKSIADSCTEHDAIVIINYFGLLDCELIIQKLRELGEKIIIIQDNVQAPFAMDLKTSADFSFSSFRKALPVPDGACVFSREMKLHQPTTESEFFLYKLGGGILKGIDLHNQHLDKIYLELFEKGEQLLDSAYDSDMSSFSKNYLFTDSWRSLSIQRKKNANVLLSGLSQMGVETLFPIEKFIEDDFDIRVPLFIPVLLDRRDKVRKAMFAENVFCPIHWPIESSEYKLKTGEKIFMQELSLVVDQRYNESDMCRILEILEKNK